MRRTVTPILIVFVALNILGAGPAVAQSSSPAVARLALAGPAKRYCSGIWVSERNRQEALYNSVLLGEPTDAASGSQAVQQYESGRLVFEIDEERRIVTAANGRGFPGLDAEDAVIHVALHAGLSGAGRIGWLRDVHLLLQGPPLDWNSLVARSRRYRVASLVGHVLDRCRFTLGAPVPPDVPELLTPRGALLTRRAFDARPPPSRAWPEMSYWGFLVSTSRTGPIETAGRAQEIIRDRLQKRSGPLPRWSAYDPQGPLYWVRESGGADGLQHYLEFASGAE